MFQLLVNFQRCCIKACNSIWSVEPVKIVTFYFYIRTQRFRREIENESRQSDGPVSTCRWGVNLEY
jgi:hypothetical protein